jgi:Flp pilus assembly protein TadB
MFFGFEIVNPDYMSELTHSLQGRTLLLYAIVSLVIGMLLLNKFSRIED